MNGKTILGYTFLLLSIGELAMFSHTIGIIVAIIIFTALLGVGAALVICCGAKHQNERLKKVNDCLEERVSERTEELEKSNAELEQFAYVASHDLKAPLRGVGNLANWIEEDVREGSFEKLSEYVMLMQRRVVFMEKLIDGLLEFSRVGRMHVEVEKVDIADIIAELREEYPEIEIHFHRECDQCPILVNSLRISQIFFNLVNNAVKYNDKEKTIIHISCKAQEEYCQFTVADNGPGIEPKYHEKIFQIFQTLQSKDDTNGTGIGLALVKKIVEEYDGEISVESTEGKGTKFIFTIKFQPAC